MELRKQLENVLYQSMKDHDEITKNTVRLILSAIKLGEIEKGHSFTDADILTIVQKEQKIRLESIEEYIKGGRTDLVEKASAENEILAQFLPKQLSDEELLKEVQAAVLEVAAQSPSDMGKVMKVLIPRLQGKVSSERISSTVKSLLQ